MTIDLDALQALAEAANHYNGRLVVRETTMGRHSIDIVYPDNSSGPVAVGVPFTLASYLVALFNEWPTLVQRVRSLEAERERLSAIVKIADACLESSGPDELWPAATYTDLLCAVEAYDDAAGKDGAK